jgi:hypothetical protein
MILGVQPNLSAVIFRRGQKKELFGDGEEGEEISDEQELEMKMEGLLEVWSAPRSGYVEMYFSI